MPNIGLPNGGKTQFFTVTYDDGLSTARGVDLAENLMNYCDSDFIWLGGLFQGVNLNTPINVNITNVANLLDTGGEWGSGIPVNLKLGEFDVLGTDPLTLMRYLLIVETSEIFMSVRQPLLFNAWFDNINEGSKGESLSLLIGVQFLREKTTVTMLPEIADKDNFVTYSVSDIWLASDRGDYISTNFANDNSHQKWVGCGTCFLFFLHDQLKFPVKQIIENGGATLADVFNHLTGKPADTAFSTMGVPGLPPAFADLVNLHYPPGDETYSPQMETVFPVPNLVALLGPSQISWVWNGPAGALQITFDQLRLSIV
jgi:hypothetical protein